MRGLSETALKNQEEVVETLYDRILGRVSCHDIYHPLTGELVVRAGEELKEDVAAQIEESPLESVEIRSVLTCESKQGVCAKCYGRNLAMLWQKLSNRTYGSERRGCWCNCCTVHW